MTSLEHESADTSASASDYGPDNWDQENWGDMDVSYLAANERLADRVLNGRLLNFQTSQDPSSPMAGTSNPLSASLNMIGTVNDARDGWDNEDWGSLEEEPVSFK